MIINKSLRKCAESATLRGSFAYRCGPVAAHTLKTTSHGKVAAGCSGSEAWEALYPQPTLKETLRMSMEAHLAELKTQHRALEAEIAEAHAHLSMDDLKIVELKRRKLLVKDEIARLQN
jgi:hypothetical protein